MEQFTGLNILEIGGPTKFFEAIYKLAKNVDCVQINSEIPFGESKSYNYLPSKAGTIFHLDGTNLSRFYNSSYDAILSCHNLEHIAATIKALKEWIRVLRKNGYLYIVLPKKEFCFDHKRPTTEFDHFLQDYFNNIGEDDQTHVEEIVNLHDISRDRIYETREQLRNRAETNFHHRQMHLHIFDGDNLQKLFDYLELETLSISHDNRNWLALAKKIKE